VCRGDVGTDEEAVKFLVPCSWFFVAKQEAKTPNQAPKPRTRNEELSTKNKEHENNTL
jgi:hypothetical protein